MRTQAASDLRSVALGLRFLPLKQAAHVLKRLAQSNDPELQLYSQTVLADGQEKLQQSFLRLRSLASGGAPSNAASFISAALHLLESPVTPDSERETIVKQTLPVAEQALNADTNHPRLIFESARLFANSSRITEAKVLHERLPARSPLHTELERLITHRAAILASQKSSAIGCAIQ